MTAINLLHLTDLHQGPKNHWQWSTYKEQFFEDLKRLSKVAGPWDLILFSGDLTYSGSKEEFDAFDATLAEIRGQLSDPGREAPLILAVPGNHDLQRNQDSRSLVVRALKRLHEDKEGHDDFWNRKTNDYHSEIARNFRGYSDWWAGSKHVYRQGVRGGLIPGDFAATYIKDGLRVGVVGLNTAFAQVTGGDYKGKLEIHSRQLEEVCEEDSRAWLRDHDVAILMTHHPPDWLHHNARRMHFNQTIFAEGTFVVHVSGHVHESRSIALGEGGADTLLLWNGISLFGDKNYRWHEHEGEREEPRSHGYAAMRIELEGQGRGFLRIWPRRAFKIHDKGLRISRDTDFKLKEFTGDYTEGSLGLEFSLKGAAGSRRTVEPSLRPRATDDLGTAEASLSRESPTGLKECLAGLSEKAPPYIAVPAEALLQGAYQAKGLHNLGLVIVRHVAAMVAAANPNPGGDPIDLPSLEWLADPPAFLETDAARKGVQVFDRRLATQRIAELMRQVLQASDETIAEPLVALVGLASKLLLLPIYAAGAMEEDCDAVELEYGELRARQQERRSRRRLDGRTQRPWKNHCFVIIPGSKSPSGDGWIVDLYPLITRVVPCDTDGATNDAEAIGVVASSDRSDGLPNTYHTETGLFRARPTVGGKRKSRGAFRATKEWYEDDEDPRLVEQLKGAGFSILRRVGHGSFGTVYRVTHIGSGSKPFAMKVLHRHIPMSQGDLRRLRREIDRVSELHGRGDGDNIVRYEVEIPDAMRLEGHDYRWFVMEFVEGESLSDWCTRVKAQHHPSERQRIQKSLIEELVRGVATLHRAGIVHRDIHPDNVIVRRSGDTYVPVIVDLGLTCFPPRSTSSAQSMSLLAAGFGRAPFAPVEQREGREPRHSDPRVDVHALGWSIACILNDGTIVEETDELPEPWKAIVLRCISQDPASRPRDAVALSEELRRSSLGEPFAVGRTLADGSYAIGGSPISGRPDLLQVVPPHPYTDLRAWAVRIELSNPTTDLPAIAKAWRELESAGVPVCPWLACGHEGSTGVISVGVFERFLSRQGRWSSLREWSATGSVRDLGAVLVATLEVMRLLCEAGLKGLVVAVSPEDVLVAPSGELRIFRISLPTGVSRHGREWLRIIERTQLSIPEHGMDGVSAMIGFHPFEEEGGEYERGRLELRHIGAILQAALDVTQEHAAVFDGNLSVWTERDSLVLDALGMAFGPVLNGWSVTIDKLALEQIEERKRFDEVNAIRRVQRQVDHERKRTEHEAKQERERTEHEAKQERERAEHEAKQERERAEHEAEQERRRAEGRQGLPDFKAIPFGRVEFLHELLKEDPYEEPVFHERLRREMGPSTIVFQFSRPVVREHVGEEHVREEHASLLARGLETAKEVVTSDDVFLRRRSLRIAQSGAWLIALLCASERCEDLVRHLTTIAEKRPWWRPEEQLTEVFSLMPAKLPFEPSIIHEDERVELHSTMTALLNKVDHEGLALPGAEADARVALARLVDIVGTIIKDIEIRRRTLDSPASVHYLAVRGDSERVLRTPITRSGKFRGPCWIHGIQWEGGGLKGSYGAPPASPLGWAPVAVGRPSTDPHEGSWLLVWDMLLSLIDEAHSGCRAELRIEGEAIFITWQPETTTGGFSTAIEWYPEEQRLLELPELFSGDTVRGRPMARLFALWRQGRANGTEREVRFVSNMVPIGALRGFIERDTGTLSSLLRDNMVMAAWAERYQVSRQELEEFGRAVRMQVMRKGELEERVNERMDRLGLRIGREPHKVCINLVRDWIAVGGEAKPVTRDALLAAIEHRGLRARREGAPSVRLYIHGWDKYAWDREPDIELDWTGYFDLRTRRVATQQEWDSTLLPQLGDAKRQLAQMPDGNGKHIDIRGKLPLSALMAIGAEFPTVGSYRFRVEQPTGEDLSLWHSDAKPSSLRFRVVDERHDDEGEDGLLVLSITGDAMPAVKAWLDGGMRAAFGAILHVQPDSGCGPAAIGSEGDAVALAEDAKAQIQALRQRHRGRRVHIVPFAPAGFCLFLGQRLNALGELVVYERTGDGTYQTGVVLKSG